MTWKFLTSITQAQSHFYCERQDLAHTVQNLQLSEPGTMLCGKMKQISLFAYAYLGEQQARWKIPSPYDNVSEHL